MGPNGTANGAKNDHGYAIRTGTSSSSSKPSVVYTVAGCHWLPWQSPWMARRVVPDPTRVFSLLVIGIMLFRYLQSHHWDVSLVVQGFFLNPYVVAFFVSAVATVWVAYDKEHWARMPVYDKWAAEWYWWNAWLYHGKHTVS
jgi:hypothetical protein